MIDASETRTPGSLRIDKRSTTLRQQVLEVLRRAIIDSHFKPGERLVERELCEMTGVSRTSVREALRHLESEGLVQNIPNKGPSVAKVTAEEAQQIYEIREVLEGLAGRLFAERATAKQVDRLQEALAKLKDAFSIGETRHIVAEATKFYDVMLEGCGNDLIRDMIRSLQARVVFLRGTSMSHPGRAPGSFGEMTLIVEAICRRDAGATEAACKQHVRQARDAALRMLYREDGSHAGGTVFSDQEDLQRERLTLPQNRGY
ncbi:MAG TPA: GntR family transcriptional regulator [Dongiaceae bacterium]|nr:GntR family transcriptional regulator [Dongiaceae bacterium]